MNAPPKLTAGLAALEWAAQYDELTTERIDGGEVGVWLRVTFPDGVISYFPPYCGLGQCSIIETAANTSSDAPEALLERAARVVEVYRALEARAATVRPCDCGGLIHADGKGRHDKACSDCIEASERDSRARRSNLGAIYLDQKDGIL